MQSQTQSVLTLPPSEHAHRPRSHPARGLSCSAVHLEPDPTGQSPIEARPAAPRRRGRTRPTASPNLGSGAAHVSAAAGQKQSSTRRNVAACFLIIAAVPGMTIRRLAEPAELRSDVAGPKPPARAGHRTSDMHADTQRPKHRLIGINRGKSWQFSRRVRPPSKARWLWMPIDSVISRCCGRADCPVLRSPRARP